MCPRERIRSVASMTTTITPPSTTSTRLHGLDALRAGALSLGIVLHSVMPFVPGLPWLINDSVTSGAAIVPMYVIHLFRMVVFMLLAGYFGRMVLHRRGTGSYVKDRLLRIGLPVIAFWPVAVLLLGILAGVGATVRGVAMPEPPPAPPGAPQALLQFTPGQLWFLVVLLQCVAITVVVRAIAVKLLGADRSARISERIGGLLSSPVGVLVATVPYLICLLLQRDSQSGVIAPTTILPEVAPLIAYLGAFLTGWFLHARSDSMGHITRQWPVHLGVAVVLTIVGFLVTPGQVSLPVHAIVIALAGWTWTFALIGLCTRFLRREIPAVRYLADASYWSYLLHLPLLVGIEILLADQPWPILLKLIITWAIAAIVLLGTYDLFVRSTWLGKWLNGHRRPRALGQLIRGS